MLLVLLSAALETVTLGAQVVRDRGVGTPLIGEVDLGMGWHESADQPASATCIHFRRDTSSAQYGESALRQVTTRHEMERHFAGSAKLSYGGVGTSFSAAIQYARSRDFRSSDMSFSLFGRAYSAEYMAGDTEVALTDEFAALARTDLPAFIKRCGTAFVYAVHRGAELSGVVQIRDVSVAERESLSAELEGKGWGYAFGAQATQSVKNLQQSGRLSVDFRFVGGPPDTLPVDAAGARRRLQTLQHAASTNPAPLLVIVRSYQNVRGFPGAGEVRTPAYRIAVARERARSLYDQTVAMIRAPQDFHWQPGTSPAVLGAVQDTLIQMMARLDRAAAECRESGPCTYPADVRPHDYTLRARLPVAIGSFHDDVLRMRYQSQIASIRREIRTSCRPTGSGHSVAWCTNRRRFLAERDGVLARLMAPGGRWETGRTEAVLNQHVRPFASAACQEEPGGAFCVSDLVIQREILPLVTMPAGVVTTSRT